MVGNENIKVMIVDDTVTYRKILTKVIESIDGVDITATASSGKIALMRLEINQPDLILLDVMMPEMDGEETLKKIKEKYPSVNVVMISAFDTANSKKTLLCLEAGALDFIPKPTTKSAEEGFKVLIEYLKPLVSIINKKKNEHLQIPVAIKDVVPQPESLSTPSISIGKIELVVIGVSTGGPNALGKVLSRLDNGMSCPILIVQHMPPMFTQSLAEKLTKITSFEVKEAEDGEIIQKNTVYIAPGGMHMVLRHNPLGQNYLAIIDTPPVNHCKPSVDVLFRSVAPLYENRVLSVVMTGMGKDGTEGVKSLKRKGAYCLVQDKKSSVVWGMPKSVFDLGLADDVIPLNDLGAKISQLVLFNIDVSLNSL